MAKEQNTSALPAGRLPVPQIPPRIISFPGGLPPFEKALRFALSDQKDAPPFQRLDCLDLELAFVVIDSFAVLEGYAPAFSDADLEALKITPAISPTVLSIVNLSRGAASATVNLAGPLLINPETNCGRQVVLENASEYSVRHRLFDAPTQG